MTQIKQARLSLVTKTSSPWTISIFTLVGGEECHGILAQNKHSCAKGQDSHPYLTGKSLMAS